LAVAAIAAIPTAAAVATVAAIAGRKYNVAIRAITADSPQATGSASAAAGRIGP
jgi:hypothetical protein